MKTSDKGVALIKSHESLRLTAYKCPAGVWTIGYGHTRNVVPGMSISRMEADRLLREDLQTSENAVNKQRLRFNQAQFDALVSFVFNVGSGNFEKSTLLRKARVNVNDPSIAYEFSRWNKANGIVLPGLKRRRKEESELYFN